jgi:hypothetical protein
MPRVVPSQVCKFIDGLPNYVVQGEMASMNHLGSGSLNAVLDLVDQVPDELLTMDNATYNNFIHAKAYIRDTIQTWIANNNAGQSRFGVQIPVSRDPVAVIKDALTKCPDQSPSPSTAELNFITDPDLRTNLRNDIGAVTRALSNGEWKAATVLAGSAAEALLLWALKQQPPAAITSAIALLSASGGLTAKPDPNLDRWNLYEFIQVAEKLGIIKPNTAKQTRLAKDFRNFIHPGVAQRLGEKCDRATAFSAVAGMEHVVRDLTP